MKKAIKLAAAAMLLTFSANAYAMPQQVPDRYYEHRDFLVQIWAGHICSMRPVWWCAGV
jgi:hypothetical protein